MTEPHPQHARGAVAGAGCFVFWGLVAVYWKQLGHVDSFELVVHRTVWSLWFLLGVLWWQGRLGLVARAFADRRLLLRNLLSGSLLMGNWLAFLWAVNNGHVLESSLGYFLVPLFNVGAGALLLGERLRRAQWLAIGLAGAGVVWLLLATGVVPWVALILVATWGGYGLVRKRSPMGALDGLTVETLLFAPFAVGWLVWLAARGKGALGHVGVGDHVLLLCSGWITAIPLVWFAYAAVRVRMTTLGLLQYISPSLQFLLGWLVYGEAFDRARLVACACIWAGLAVYTADGLRVARRLQRAGG